MYMIAKPDKQHKFGPKAKIIYIEKLWRKKMSKLANPKKNGREEKAPKPLWTSHATSSTGSGFRGFHLCHINEVPEKLILWLRRLGGWDIR